VVSVRGVKAGRGRPVNNQRSVCTESTRIVHYSGSESSVILLVKRRQMGSHDAPARTPQTQMRIRDLTYTKSAYIYIYTECGASLPLGVRHWESDFGSALAFHMPPIRRLRTAAQAYCSPDAVHGFSPVCGR